MTDDTGIQTHDPLCPQRECDACAWKGPGCCRGDCRCDLIAEIRADERKRVLAEGPYFTSVVHHCCVELQDLKAKS